MTQRGRPRSGLIYSLRVKDSHAGRTLGMLVNLSATGLMLLGKQPLDPGSTVHLQISLPRVLNLGRIVEAIGAVAWCHHDESGDCFSGIRLVEMSEQASSAIDRLLEEYVELTAIPIEVSDPYLQSLKADDISRMMNGDPGTD